MHLVPRPEQSAVMVGVARVLAATDGLALLMKVPVQDWFIGQLCLPMTPSPSTQTTTARVEFNSHSSTTNLPLDTIGESARNRFGRPYISGRPLLSCDRKKIVEMYNNGARKITIARTIGVTHSCVSKVIRRFHETGAIENKGSRTASCACPGEASVHDPKVCRHVKFRNETEHRALCSQKNRITAPKVFSIEWILSDLCHSKHGKSSQERKREKEANFTSNNS